MGKGGDFGQSFKLSEWVKGELAKTSKEVCISK